MNFSKKLKFFKGLLKLKFFGQRIPLTVIFNLTNRCNSQCIHCYANYWSHNSIKELSTSQIKSLLKELSQDGCCRISFSGGEPLLRKDLGELIEYGISLGLGITVNSNGILVPEYIDILKKVDSLAISLDGRPEHHDIFRGKGSGRKALEAVKLAVKNGLRVHTNTVLHKYNLEDIDYILGLAGEYGFRAEFNLVITNIFGEGISSEEIKPSNEEYRKAIKYIIEKKKKGAPILFSSSCYKSVLEHWVDFRKEAVIKESETPGIPECPAGKFFCLIDAEGRLWSCPHLMGRVEAKNVLEVGIKEAFKNAFLHPCRGCYQIYHHEFSLLMNLHPEVVWNYIWS